MSVTTADSVPALARLIMGFRATQLVHVAAKLRLADHLAHQAMTPAKLAEVTGAKPRALHRLLRALSTLDIVKENADGSFVPTAQGALLRSDVPGSLRNIALLYGDAALWKAYGNVYHSVMTEEPGFAHAHGLPFYDYLHEHAETADLFNAAMSAFSAQESQAILAAYDFSRASLVIDVGGGEGALVGALLEAHPQLSGLVFDLPETVSKATAKRADARLQFASGDFFQKVPRGGDVYMLKSILHNWSDADAARILTNCRKAMPADGRLLVIERVIPEGNEPSEAKLFDINMLVVVGGQERTARDYDALFRAAGFAEGRVVPTKGAMSVIEARPA